MNDTKMATIYLFGKKYEVPAELTVMTAMDADAVTDFAVPVPQFTA